MKLKSTFAFYLLGVTLGAQSVRNGEDLLRAMHDRYNDSWYQTVTFVVKSTVYMPGGTTSADTFHEALQLPGKLRIDEAPGKGELFVDGTLIVIDDNKAFATEKNTNIIRVLGFDVYRQDPAKTVEIVKEQGYDLSKIHEDTWEGKPAYVVGAEKDDLKSNQFWVAKDTLLFLREIAPSRANPPLLDDIRFSHYQPLAGAWFAAEMEVIAGRIKTLTEEYSDIQANVKLAPGTFDPEKFATTHWEK